MKHITTTRASRADYRLLNHRRRAEMSQLPAWVTLAGVLALIAILCLSTP